MAARVQMGATDRPAAAAAGRSHGDPRRHGPAKHYSHIHHFISGLPPIFPIPSFLVRTNSIREFKELSDRVSFIG